MTWSVIKDDGNKDRPVETSRKRKEIEKASIKGRDRLGQFLGEGSRESVRTIAEALKFSYLCFRKTCKNLTTIFAKLPSAASLKISRLNPWDISPAA